MDIKQEKALILQLPDNPEAFAILYEDNYGKVFNYLLRRVGKVDIAQDLTSETFLKALKNLKHYRYINLPFSCWLYKIASNEINQYYRKHKQELLLSSTSLKEDGFIDIAGKNPEDELLAAEEKLKTYQDFLNLQKKIILLDLKYQEVITLKYFEKKTFPEICLILNKKEGTVKSLLHRGLSKLKTLLSQEE